MKNPELMKGMAMGLAVGISVMFALRPRRKTVRAAALKTIKAASGVINSLGCAFGF